MSRDRAAVARPRTAMEPRRRRPPKLVPTRPRALTVTRAGAKPPSGKVTSRAETRTPLRRATRMAVLRASETDPAVERCLGLACPLSRWEASNSRGWARLMARAADMAARSAARWWWPFAPSAGPKAPRTATPTSRAATTPSSRIAACRRRGHRPSVLASIPEGRAVGPAGVGSGSDRREGTQERSGSRTSGSVPSP